MPAPNPEDAPATRSDPASDAETPAHRGLRGLFERHVRPRLQQTEADSLTALQATVAAGEQGPIPIDTKVIVVFLVVAINLTLIQYYGMSSSWGWLEPVLGFFGDPTPMATLRTTFRFGPYSDLYSLLFWVGSTFLGYFVVPALVVKLVFKERLRDYGLRFSGLGKHLHLYVLMYLVVLPLVLIAAQSPSFLKTYPFYMHADRSLADFLMWEVAYAAQFFALEFFFRGFMIHGTRHRLGWYSVVVMAVPYCMIHFGKPLPETIGAIIAGVVLGSLSLWTRSIWLGVLIHVSVALTMDLLAVWLKS